MIAKSNMWGNDMSKWVLEYKSNKSRQWIVSNAEAGQTYEFYTKAEADHWANMLNQPSKDETNVRS